MQLQFCTLSHRVALPAQAHIWKPSPSHPTRQNDFQKAFWKLRASEQESYNLQYSPLKPRIVSVVYALRPLPFFAERGTARLHSAAALSGN